MAAALRLLVNGPQLIFVAAFAIVTVLLEVFMRYSRYASVFRWLTISLFAYVATVFAVDVPWLTVAQNLVVPHIRLSGDYLAIVVAVFGTTISPYCSSGRRPKKSRMRRRILKRTPRTLDRLWGNFSSYDAIGRLEAPMDFMNSVGVLLPMELWGRCVLYSCLNASHFTWASANDKNQF